jgi:hypothetical protein
MKRLAAALAVTLLFTGCTSIPTGEVAAFDRAFREADTQTRQVLADHAAARREGALLAAQAGVSAAPTVTDLSLETRLALGPADADPADGAEADIAARLLAWEVLGKYHAALLALAAGRSSQEVEGAVTGLLGHLQAIPVKQVGDAIGAVVPYGAVLAKLTETLQREAAARRFGQAVTGATPLMQEFTDCLAADARLFAEYRRALFNRNFTRAESEMIGLVGKFRARVNSPAGSSAPAGAVRALIGRVNAARGLTPTGPSFEELSPPAAPADPAPALEQEVALVQLETLAAAIETRAATARAIAAKFSAYHGLMTRYARFLRELRQTHDDLQSAVSTRGRRLPSAAELEQAIAHLRLAHDIYLQNR